MKSIFMLAEGDSAYLPESGFDPGYASHMFKMMEKVAKGERPAIGLDSIKHKSDSMYPANTIQMYFTSNHVENSWNKADCKETCNPQLNTYSLTRKEKWG